VCIDEIVLIEYNLTRLTRETCERENQTCDSANPGF
jgi:hypothetical protein